MKRRALGILFGGRSAEHEISIRSTASIIEALDRSKYEIRPILIRKDGGWEIPAASAHPFLEGLGGERAVPVHLPPDPALRALVPLDPQDGPRPLPDGRLDVIFPVLHGTYGEDGTIQGLLDLSGIPYVGAGTAASAVGMDKALMKSVFRDRGLPVTPSVIVLRFEWKRGRDAVIQRLEGPLQYPFFVKPANLGSSVGVSKVEGREQLDAALAKAFRYDRKAIVEQAVDAREIEVSVLGNDEPVASAPGEIVPCREFYDYEAKYVDESSELLIPAPLDEDSTARARALAVEAFRAIDASGMARVDLFYDRREHRLLVNEINTIPGFTSISMYPKLWEATGLPMSALIDRLIELALERAREKASLETSYPTPPKIES